MSDLWFDGFPELMEHKQIVLALYQEHDKNIETKPQTIHQRPVPHAVKVHMQKGKPPSRRKRARAISNIKAAA